MKIYLVHCGFYDSDLAEGVYEAHTNFFVAAESFEDARAKVKLEPIYRKRKMHVDGLQELNAVSGYQIRLEYDEALGGKTQVLSSRHRTFGAPTPAPTK